MHKKLLTAIAALAVSGGIATANAQELKAAFASFGGELVDPIHGGLASQIYQWPLFDYLVTFDAKMQFAPGLATGWTVSPDGKVYTFKLRNDVKWHTGDAFTADDVLYHFKRLEKGTAPYAGPLLQVISSITAPDAHTVVFTLKQAFPDFIAHLSPGNTTLGAITPSAYIQKVGEAEFQNKLVGTGPWKLVERQKGNYFLFERVDHPYRPKSGYQRLRVLNIPEESTRLAMIQRGEADLIDIGPDSVAKVKAAAGQVFEVPASVVPVIGFVGPWEDRAKTMNLPTRLENTKVRQALSMAIDRQELVEFLMQGYGRPAVAFPTFPGALGYDEAWQKANAVTFDPAGAKKLLAEAGYPNGFNLKFYTTSLGGAPWLPQMVQVIAGYWKKVGVNAEIIVSEVGALLPVLYTRPDVALGAAYTYRTTKSVFPVGTLQNYVTAEGKSQLAMANWDADFQKVIDETDPAKREAMFKAFVHRLKESYLAIPVFYASALFAGGKNVSNWSAVDGWPTAAFAYDHVKPRQ